MSMLASALPAEGGGSFAPGRPPWDPAPGKRYAALFAAWGKREEMVAACLPYWGQPDSIDTIVEPTGDTERFEALIHAGPEPPRPPAAEADRAHGMPAAAGLAAVMALSVATRSSRVGWILAGLAVLGVALVALGWTVWQDRQVVRHWRRTLAEAREEQRERLTGHARRLRIRRSRITVSEVPPVRAAR